MKFACTKCGKLSDQKRCPKHRRKGWEETSPRRRQRRLSGSAEQARNKRVMREWKGVCHVCGQRGAEMVDHVVPVGEGGSDDFENLRPIHRNPCHRKKTAAEAARARARKRESQ